MFHLNPDTGKTGLCKAENKCPFGGSENHFATEAQARASYEARSKSQPWQVYTSKLTLRREFRVESARVGEKVSLGPRVYEVVSTSSSSDGKTILSLRELGSQAEQGGPIRLKSDHTPFPSEILSRVTEDEAAHLLASQDSSELPLRQDLLLEVEPQMEVARAKLAREELYRGGARPTDEEREQSELRVLAALHSAQAEESEILTQEARLVSMRHAQARQKLEELEASSVAKGLAAFGVEWRGVKGQRAKVADLEAAAATAAGLAHRAREEEKALR